MRSLEKREHSQENSRKRVTNSGLPLKLRSSVIIPLIPPSFVLPHLCPSPFSLGSGQGRAAPAGWAALCWGSSASSLLGAGGESLVRWSCFASLEVKHWDELPKPLLWASPVFLLSAETTLHSDREAGAILAVLRSPMLQEGCCVSPEICVPAQAGPSCDLG